MVNATRTVRFSLSQGLRVIYENSLKVEELKSKFENNYKTQEAIIHESEMYILENMDDLSSRIRKRLSISLIDSLNVNGFSEEYLSIVNSVKEVFMIVEPKLSPVFIEPHYLYKFYLTEAYFFRRKIRKCLGLATW